ncbi:hypothetical protein FO440_09715 [Mucilaginibacter corticis]|uniref:Uncharacterized protein n=1 Tax=Mucilaginibacter corticis TaxID=2597670 RepID=A0A556MX51_9SPHI|nr:hypothetical protein [Mucilaginibacter corticis]TSJ44433.1 hypothetical protein FO440_09715 [Mucilaginibacter corticis]
MLSGTALSTVSFLSEKDAVPIAASAMPAGQVHYRSPNLQPARKTRPGILLPHSQTCPYRCAIPAGFRAARLELAVAVHVRSAFASIKSFGNE